MFGCTEPQSRTDPVGRNASAGWILTHPYIHTTPQDTLHFLEWRYHILDMQCSWGKLIQLPLACVFFFKNLDNHNQISGSLNVLFYLLVWQSISGIVILNLNSPVLPYHLQTDIQYFPTIIIYVKYIGLWRWCINIRIIILDTIYRPVFYLNHNVSETGFCLRFHVV
jgi:hypothetical protein